MLPNSLSTGLTALYYAFERAEVPAAVATAATINKAVFGLLALLGGLRDHRLGGGQHPHQRADAGAARLERARHAAQRIDLTRAVLNVTCSIRPSPSQIESSMGGWG